MGAAIFSRREETHISSISLPSLLLPTSRYSKLVLSSTHHVTVAAGADPAVDPRWDSNTKTAEDVKDCRMQRGTADLL